MGWRAFAKGPEPAQEAELLLAEAGDVGECLRPGQHREQTKQQHLVERIHDLRALPMIRQILEITQKNNRLANRPALGSTPRPSQSSSRNPNQRTSTDSAICSLCHPFLHPIALRRPRQC